MQIVVPLLVTIYVIVLIGIIVFMLLSAARPTKTLAWLIIIIFVPIIGLLFYFTFGINRRKYKFFKIKRSRSFKRFLERANRFYEELDSYSADLPDIADHLKLVKIIIKNSHSLPHDGNKVEVLQNGRATFDAIFDAMRKARSFIHVQFYIYEEGELLRQMCEIMEAKVKEGVEVRLIYDGLGSYSLPKKFWRKLKAAGIKACSFMPIRFWYISPGLNYRNHRKIVIVDGEVGFIGGFNVADKYIRAQSELGIWRDTHIQFEGPAVRSLSAVFANDWYFVSQSEELQDSRYFPKVREAGESTVQIVSSGPDTDFPAVMQQYFTTITQARQYVYIANSYIIPGEAMLEALIATSLSGVEVRLLLPETFDSVLVKWTVRSYLEQLLEAGVRIFLYQKSFLHCKVIIADDTLASVGTANLDIRSFEQNFEVNAVIYDPAVAMALKRDFEEDFENSRELNLAEYLKRSYTERLLEGSARIFSPVL